MKSGSINPYLKNKKKMGRITKKRLQKVKRPVSSPVKFPSFEEVVGQCVFKAEAENREKLIERFRKILASDIMDIFKKCQVPVTSPLKAVTKFSSLEEVLEHSILSVYLSEQYWTKPLYSGTTERVLSKIVKTFRANLTVELEEDYGSRMAVRDGARNLETFGPEKFKNLCKKLCEDFGIKNIKEPASPAFQEKLGYHIDAFFKEVYGTESTSPSTSIAVKTPVLPTPSM